MEKIDLSEAISKAKELPALPQTVARLLKELRNPDVDLDELSREIALDQAITAKILRLVNSSFYGMPGQIGNLSQAVVILGTETIQNVILSIAIIKAFKLPDIEAEGFSLEDFWRHTIATGLITQTIARMLELPNRQDAFVAGLLHDIGKLLLLQVSPEGFCRVVELVREKGLFFQEAERLVLTADHTSLGAWLAKKWHFPVHLQEVLFYHHRPGKAKHMLVRAVRFGDSLALAMGIGHGGSILVPPVGERVWKELGFDKSGLAPLLDELGGIFKDVRETARIFLE